MALICSNERGANPPVGQNQRRHMTMDAATRQALEESIAHWIENIEARTFSEAKIFADHCALCKMFTREREEDGETVCDGCPVYEATETHNCNHRRWHACWETYKQWSANETSIEARNNFRTAAQAMHDFLVSLRP